MSLSLLLSGAVRYLSIPKVLKLVSTAVFLKIPFRGSSVPDCGDGTHRPRTLIRDRFSENGGNPRIVQAKRRASLRNFSSSRAEYPSATRRRSSLSAGGPVTPRSKRLPSA